MMVSLKPQACERHNDSLGNPEGRSCLNSTCYIIEVFPTRSLGSASVAQNTIYCAYRERFGSLEIYLLLVVSLHLEK